MDRPEKKLLFTLFILMVINSASALNVSLKTKSNYNSIGFYIDSASLKISNRISATAQFSGPEKVWRNCMPLSVYEKNGIKHIAGSIVLLNENTLYYIKVTVYDSASSGSIEISGTATTLAGFTMPVNEDTLWVDDKGSGNSYSYEQPGKIEQLFSADNAKIKCGTTIVCKEGEYYTGELSYTVNFTGRPCTDKSKPIIITGENDKVIFDGQDTFRSGWSKWTKWTKYDSINHIYKITLNAEDEFSTELLMDGKRLFPYACLYTVPYGIGIPVTRYYFESLNGQMFGSGFYRIKNIFYVKLANNENPATHVFTVSKRKNWLVVSNQSLPENQKFIIKNITLKNYSKPIITYDLGGNVSSEGPATAIVFYNTSDIVLDKVNFEYNTMSVSFNGAHSNILIQGCNIVDETGLWMHGQFKNTALTRTGDLNFLFNNNDQGRFGRILEYSTLWFETGISVSSNIVIRNNTINGVVSGVGARLNYAYPYYDIDIHNNTIKNCYDAIDKIGDAINERIWQNTITHNPVNLSFISSPTGPVYVFRNVFDQICDRSNPLNKVNSFNPELYVNHNICFDPVKPKIWGTLLKLNTGTTGSSNPQLDINLFHNTIVSHDTLGYSSYLGNSGNWRLIRSVNNNYCSKFVNFIFTGISANKNYGFYSSGDNIYSGTKVIAKIEPVHVSNCTKYENPDSMYKGLINVTGNQNAAKLYIKSQSTPPLFMDSISNNYHLNSLSKLIDTGEFVPNISDWQGENYMGSKPDIGAFESGFSATKNYADLSKVFVYPNPTQGNVTVRSKDIRIEIVEVFNLDGRIIYRYKNNSNDYSFTFQLSEFPSGIYILKLRQGKNTYNQKLMLFK